MVIVTGEPLDTARLAAELENHGAGCLVSFEGRVRGENGGREVRSLYYEGYVSMIRRVLSQIRREAMERWNLCDAAVAHRTGHVPLGGIAVWVGVLAPHREDAFSACRYVIDEVKRRAPLWKRETYADGSRRWVQPDLRPGAFSSAAV